MNFQNLTFDYVERPRAQPYQRSTSQSRTAAQADYTSRPDRTTSSSEDSQDTLRLKNNDYDSDSDSDSDNYNDNDNYNDENDSHPDSATPQLTVIPHAPSPPSPPSASESPSVSEIYGPDRLGFGLRGWPGSRQPQRASGAGAGAGAALAPPALLPTSTFAELRNKPDLTLADIKQIGMEAELKGQAAAGLGITLKDQLAWEAAKVTPGVDDAPYIQFALEAITRDRETGLFSNKLSHASDEPNENNPIYRVIPTRGIEHILPMPVQPPEAMYAPPHHQQRHSERYHHPRLSDEWSNGAGGRRTMADPSDPRPISSLPPSSPSSSLSTLVHSPQHHHQHQHHQQQQQPAQGLLERQWQQQQQPLLLLAGGETITLRPPPRKPAVPWGPQESVLVIDMTRTDRDTQRRNPPATFRPPILRPLPLLALMALTSLMTAALVFCAVFSQLREGFWAYGGSIHSGRYFVFRILPQLLASAILLWSQAVTMAVLRVLPFARLASPSPSERLGAMFEDMYDPAAYLRPRLTGPWQVWVPMVVTWLSSLALPLQSALFTVILVEGEWRWAAVQGVAWTLVAMYVALVASTAVVLLHWKGRRDTGLIWDCRSIADVAALVSHSNVLADYRGTEVMGSKAELRRALRWRAVDRLAYWSTAEYRPEFWYALGGMKRFAFWLQQNGVVAARDGPVPYTQQQEGQRQNEKLDGEIDIEASPHSPAVRYRYLPWCMRDGPVASFVAAAALLLTALLVVSFLPSTNIRGGFFPGIPVAPVGGAFSAADFLYSFLPSLLGLILFLAFQCLDMWLRILSPWAELSRRHRRSLRRGALADRSVLADYAACGWPLQAAWRAGRNGQWRVAASSLLSFLFVLLPVLGGGVFMALTLPSGEVRMLPNVPCFAVVLSLACLYLVALAGVFLLPPSARRAFRLPHGVTSLAEVVSFVANDDAAGDPAFRDVRNKTTLRGKAGCDRRADEQDRWVFGLGPGKDARLGVRRLARFTELQRMSRRQRRGTVGGGGGGGGNGPSVVV